MATVRIVHWNPSRPVLSGRLGSILPIRRKVNNFGDLLGPEIVHKILSGREVSPKLARHSKRLLAVGSILRMAKNGDTVWGAGANGKSLLAPYSFSTLDVRAVRGPLTAKFLREKGVSVPEVYGDPGLLVGQLWTRDELRQGMSRRRVTVIPNLNDMPRLVSRGIEFVNPTAPLDEVVALIASSELVVGSSLHAIVVAESLGIPARLVRSEHEPSFKYDDYYLGSGRRSYEPAESVEEAIEAGGEPSLFWDSEPLLGAFPFDLWLASAEL